MKKIATLIVVALVAGLSITALAAEGKNVSSTTQKTQTIKTQTSKAQPTTFETTSVKKTVSTDSNNVLPTEEPQTTSVTPELKEIQPTFVCPNNNPNCTQNGDCLNDGTCINNPESEQGNGMCDGTGQGNGVCDGTRQGSGQGNGNGNGRCRQ